MRYFNQEDLPDPLCCFVFGPLHTVECWVLYRTTQRYHVLRLRSLKPGYHDPDVAVSLKPKLIMDLDLCAQNTIRVLVKHPELVEPFFASPGWKREPDYVRSTFLIDFRKHLGPERAVQLIIDQNLRGIRSEIFADIVAGDFNGFVWIMKPNDPQKNGRYLYTLS
ncbi:hypothetical protein GGE65_008270 [Skermanella aerolata]|uniref:hypothetical protein n=1 Tax=Skermanella aerolata TaxID=393310 RepID=UPI003D22D3DF